MFTGELLIYWFIVVFIVYVIKTSFLKTKKPIEKVI